MVLFGPGTADTEAHEIVSVTFPSPKAPIARIPLMPTRQTHPILPLEGSLCGEALRVVDLMEHQLAWDLCLRAVQFAGPAFEC